VIVLRPGVMPLEAVRRATEAWDTSSELPPEKAAEVYITTHQTPSAPRRH
jgi:hypothetical protein